MLGMEFMKSTEQDELPCWLRYLNLFTISGAGGSPACRKVAETERPSTRKEARKSLISLRFHHLDATGCLMRCRPMMPSYVRSMLTPSSKSITRSISASVRYRSVKARRSSAEASSDEWRL